MARKIEAQVIQKIATEAEWSTSTITPYKGEIMLVSDNTGKVINIKVGDGNNKFPNLNYMFPSYLPDYIEVGTVAELRALTSLNIIALQAGIYRGVRLNGYYEEGDTPESIEYYISDTAEEDDGGSVFVVGTVKLEHEFEGEVETAYFGAKGDSIQDSTPYIQKALDYIYKKNGGVLKISEGNHFVTTDDDNYACLHYSGSNLRITGYGAKSVLFTMENSHVPIHISSEPDLTKAPSSENMPYNISIDNIKIKGTGNYQYFGLAKGRGILLRKVVNVSIHHNWVEDMSMIGIVLEWGNGYYSCNDNHVMNCKYTSINFNGRCYQSTISDNICSGSDGHINSVAIQADGHCIITGNTVFGSITNPERCGGIIWGEGNFDGIGTISNNIVKHCRFGIRAVYHGSVVISNNSLINISTTAAISLTGTVHPSFTRGNSDNVVSSNQMVNCVNGIDCSSPNTLFIGNKVRNISDPINPSANTEPDAILPQTTICGIRLRAEGCSLIGNEVGGCTRGLTSTIEVNNGVLSANKIEGNTIDYSIESAQSGTFAISGNQPLPERTKTTIGYVENIVSNSRPTTGHYPLASQWKIATPSLVSRIGSVVVYAVKRTTTATASGGSTSITVDNPTGISTANPTGTVLGIQLDNNTWHWTTAQSFSGSVLTIGTAIPTGRSVNIGASILYNYWEDLSPITMNGQWNGSHIVMGAYHVWIGGDGALRIKSTSPANSNDGNVIIQNSSTYNATTTVKGLVNQSASSADTATPPSSTYTQAEVQAILTELRDLKTKLRTAGILAT